MNELLPEGELFPEEIQFKLETLLRAKFLVEATNLITEVKTPWLSIFRSSIPANMMLLQHHQKSFSMGKGRLWCCAHHWRSGSAAQPPGRSWSQIPAHTCPRTWFVQERLLSLPRAPNVLSPAGPGLPGDLPAEAAFHESHPTPHQWNQWRRLQVITQERFSSNKIKS